MKGIKRIIIPVVIIGIMLLLNSLSFFIFKCQPDYIENRTFKGETQSVTKQSLTNQTKILNQLPTDSEQALLYINQAIAENEEYNLARKDIDMSMSVQAEKMDIKDYYNIKELIEEKLQYDAMRENMEETAVTLSKISIFNQNMNEAGAQAAIKDFYGVKNLTVSIVLDYGINAWISYKIGDIIVIIFTVVFALYMVQTRQNKKEYTQTYVYQKAIGLFILILATAMSYVINLILTFKHIEKYDLQIWVQSLKSFHNYPVPMRLITFIMIYISTKVLFSVVIYSLITMVFYIEKSKKVRYAVIIFTITFAEAILCFISGKNGLSLFLREINIFSTLSVERFFMTYLNLSIFGSIIPRFKTYYFLLALITVACVVLLDIYENKYHRKNMEEIQYKYYEEINQKYAQTRQLWHDFQNHLITIQELIRREEIEAANKYLLELEEEIDNAHVLTRSGSSALDVLIYQKSEEAKENQITLDIKINANIKSEEFQDVAICCVVGNLLDNCIEAVKKLEIDKRKASLEIEKRGDMLYIVAKNDYEGEIVKSASVIKSSKTNGTHGLGLQSVKHVCEKYQGSMNIDYSDKKFKVQALMMANKK